MNSEVSCSWRCFVSVMTMASGFMLFVRVSMFACFPLIIGYALPLLALQIPFSVLFNE